MSMRVDGARIRVRRYGNSGLDGAGGVGLISVSTIHMATGGDFLAVVVLACDDESIPLQQRIESVTDGADLDEIYATERHLLYVACTRARDHLLVTAVDPASEFLDDFTG
jgi:superfamily I DNA/RNA helicase